MERNKREVSIWQRILIIFAFTISGVVVVPPLSFIILYILYKLMPNNVIYTLVIGFPFIWGPILGVILGISVGIKIAISQKKA